MKLNKDLEKSDKTIVSGAILIALLLFSFLVYDILYLNMQTEGLIEIGEIYQKQNRVKKKVSSSLIWYETKFNETVYENDWIFTGSESIAKIKLKTGGEIIIEPDSMIILSRKNGVLELNLQHGRLMADVKNKEIQINVIREDSVEKVDTDQGIVSISQKNEIEKPEIDIISKDEESIKNGGLSVSDLIDQKYFKTPEGFKSINKLGILFKKDPQKKIQLFAGQTTDVEFAWMDPFKKYSDYEIEISTDPDFKDVLESKVTPQIEHRLMVQNDGVYYWKLRGLDQNQQPSEWSEVQTSTLDITVIEKGRGVELTQKKLQYNINPEQASNIQPDKTIQLGDEDESLNISWQKDELAKNYRVQISDTDDFSNIIEEKIVDENQFKIDHIKIGETFFRVVPENERGEALADESRGKITTFLPAPNESSMKTVDKVEHLELSWDKVPYAETYEVSYLKNRETQEKIVEYTNSNKLKVVNETGFLQWKVRVVEPKSKKRLSSYTGTQDWYDAAKRLASLHGTGQAGTHYPVITEPVARKTYISVNQSPLFIAMKWTYEKETTGYEVEISKKPDMSELIYKKTVNDKKKAYINQKLDPGIYYMRVRALNEDVTLESWSETEIFRVLDQKK